MKKIFIFVAAVAMVACSDNPKSGLYCQSEANRTYTDATAEFDTLSYAIGMNLGMSVNIQQADFGLDTDAVISAMNNELKKSVVDYDFIEANRDRMQEFTNKQVRPYMTIKRGFRTDRPDTLKLPELYNEEYTPTIVSEWMGYDMGNYVRTVMLPVNMHWVNKAMEDSKALKSRDDIADNMSIDAMQMGAALSNYFQNVMPEYSKRLSAEWLKEVSQRKGVEMLVTDKDTIYYRIDAAGSDERITSNRDTVSFHFKAYTRRGSFVESTADRANQVREQIAKVKEDKSLAEDARQSRIDQLTEQVAAAETPNIPLAQFRLPGAIEGMKLVGKGGKITIWMPASMAYGSRGNRMVLPNEAIVMTIELLDIKHNDTPKEVPMPGKGRVTPVKVDPATGEPVKKPITVEAVPVKK